jgi:hypothetical protein
MPTGGGAKVVADTPGLEIFGRTVSGESAVGECLLGSG